MIEFTLLDDRKIYVNPSQIVTIGTSHKGTAISFPSIGDEILIKEDAEEAARICKNWALRFAPATFI